MEWAILKIYPREKKHITDLFIKAAVVLLAFGCQLSSNSITVQTDFSKHYGEMVLAIYRYANKSSNSVD